MIRPCVTHGLCSYRISTAARWRFRAHTVLQHWISFHQSSRDFEALAETLYVGFPLSFIAHLYLLEHKIPQRRTQVWAAQSSDWAQHRTKCAYHHLTTVSPLHLPAPLARFVPCVFSRRDGMSSPPRTRRCFVTARRTKMNPLPPPPRELDVRCRTLIIAISLRRLPRRQSRGDESDAALGVVGKHVGD